MAGVGGTKLDDGRFDDEILIHGNLLPLGDNPVILLLNHCLSRQATRDIRGRDHELSESRGHSMDAYLDQQGFRESDLAREICLGRGASFKGEQCQYFDRTSWECELLRHRPIEAVYEQRCLPPSEFYVRAHRILNRYPDHLRGEFIDLEEFIHGFHDVERGRKGILDYPVRVPTIHYMYSLINMALSQEIQRTLILRGLIHPVRTCGNCLNRGPVEPHMCELEKVSGGAGGKTSINPHFGTERNSGVPACGHYSPRAFFQNPIDLEGPLVTNEYGVPERFDPQEKICSKEIADVESEAGVEALFKAIRECIENAPSAKKAEIFSRWLEDNAFIYQRLGKLSYEEAKSKLLDVRTRTNKGREAYSVKIRRDREDLEACISGEKRCESGRKKGGSKL